jgi:hypothetical protein
LDESTVARFDANGQRIGRQFYKQLAAANTLTSGKRREPACLRRRTQLDKRAIGFDGLSSAILDGREAYPNSVRAHWSDRYFDGAPADS